MTREEFEAEKRAIAEEIAQHEAIITGEQNKLRRLHAELKALKYQYLAERTAVQRHMDRD